MNRIRDYLGLQHNILIMLLAVLLVGMGEEIWSRFVPKYLEMVGATTLAIAAYGTLEDLLDAIYQYPGGLIADRLGRRRSLVLFIAISLLGYLLYLGGGSWKWILVGTIFVSAWGSLGSPAMFAIIGDNLPSERRAIGFGVQSILKRIPMAIAPVIGGWLLTWNGFEKGVRIGLGITILLAILAIFAVLLWYREDKPGFSGSANLKEIWRSMNPALKRLLLADCLARWAEGIPRVFIVLYVMNILRAGAMQFGWLSSAQMIAALIVYIPISKLSDRGNRKPFIALTFAFFALYPLTLVSASSLGWIFVAFIAGGLREIGEPARKAMIVDLAHDRARGHSVGVYYLIRGIAVFPASLLGGWLWTLDYHLPFYVAFAMGFAGLTYYVLSIPFAGTILQREDEPST